MRTLETERLLLRRMEPSDAAVVHAYRSDPEVARFQSWGAALAGEIAASLEAAAASGPGIPGDWFQMAIVLRETGSVVGDCGIRVPEQEPRQAEIGITLAPAFQGRGLATESLEAILGWLLGDLGKHRVFASVDPRNGASIALMQRVGMRQEAHLVESLWFKGAWADDLIFAILQREWRRRPPGGGKQVREP